MVETLIRILVGIGMFWIGFGAIDMLNEPVQLLPGANYIIGVMFGMIAVMIVGDVAI